VKTVSVPHKTNVTKLQSSYISAQEEKREKASRRRRIAVVRFTFFSVVLAALSSIFLYTLHSQSKDIEAKLADKKQLEQQLDKLEKQQKHLKEEIKKLHDDEYIAELARKKYYLSKDGEIIFVVPEK
jgi:cell division protein DivIC